ncbi:hypothetical protein L1887_26994 [Cichorium endivia]|nr:hypothetical protein L1887_26994 [Cichorium endivia]
MILILDHGKLVGKMKFVDLASYEYARRNTIDGSGTNLAESTRINKSLNALLNVIHALYANETCVPCRESKVAQVLQYSLGGNNNVSMIFCLNPLFCPDTIHVVTLASRLKNIKHLAICSTVKKQTKPPLFASKQQTNSRLPLSAEKNNSMLNGRKKNPPNIVKSDVPYGGSTVVKEGKGSYVEVASDIVYCLPEEVIRRTTAWDDLKGISGIKEKRASHILELREKSPQPFKS